MKLTKENVCVFIEDEAQLEQARELLVKYDEPIFFALIYVNNFKYLKIGNIKKEWFMGFSKSSKIQITLTELEKILKDGKEN